MTELPLNPTVNKCIIVCIYIQAIFIIARVLVIIIMATFCTADLGRSKVALLGFPAKRKHKCIHYIYIAM